ncbi:MAG: hypothetical protein FWH17_01300 [Oscillospiraceae bacterium]|nr:hypothetical protein [Oscillospiraceae bacterium]
MKKTIISLLTVVALVAGFSIMALAEFDLPADGHTDLQQNGYFAQWITDGTDDLEVDLTWEELGNSIGIVLEMDSNPGFLSLVAFGAYNGWSWGEGQRDTLSYAFEDGLVYILWGWNNFDLYGVTEEEATAKILIGQFDWIDGAVAWDDLGVTGAFLISEDDYYPEVPTNFTDGVVNLGDFTWDNLGNPDFQKGWLTIEMKEGDTDLQWGALRTAMGLTLEIGVDGSDIAEMGIVFQGDATNWGWDKSELYPIYTPFGDDREGGYLDFFFSGHSTWDTLKTGTRGKIALDFDGSIDVPLLELITDAYLFYKAPVREAPPPPPADDPTPPPADVDPLPPVDVETPPPADVETPPPASGGDSDSSGGLDWWMWLIFAAGAVVIIVVIIIIAKKKK